MAKKQIFVPYIAAFGGVERLIVSLSRFLHDQSIDHEVVCFDDTIDLAKHATWPLKVVSLKPARKSLAEAKALRKHCRSSEAGDLLLFDLKGAFYAGLAAMHVFHLHLTDPPSLLSVESSRNSKAYRKWANDLTPTNPRRRLIGEIVHRINRRGVRQAKNVIVMTQRIADEIQSLYHVVPVVFRPGVNVEPTAVVRTSDTTRRILSVSRLEESKRIDVAIDALSELLSDSSVRETDWQLEIAGAGPAREELQQFAKKRGVAENVQFLGRVSDEELEAAYARASVFVMPAVQGYGLPALEALCRHVPVVLHRDSGVSEILSDSPWTEVIDSNSALAPAINRLWERSQKNELTVRNLPAVPTDTQWATQIAKVCGWIV